MKASSEFGVCEICGEDCLLQRTYFRYNMKCECHSPQHFELIKHCDNCIPKEPEITKISIKTCNLRKTIKDHANTSIKK